MAVDSSVNTSLQLPQRRVQAAAWRRQLAPTVVSRRYFARQLLHDFFQNVVDLALSRRSVIPRLRPLFVAVDGGLETGLQLLVSFRWP